MKVTLVLGIFLLAFASVSHARTIREMGPLDSLKSADSIFRLTVISGRECKENKDCRAGDKIYNVKNDGAVFGKFIEVNQLVERLNLCIGCQYYATQRIGKNDKNIIEIFPANVMVDPETSEKYLLVLNSDFLIPLNKMKSKTLSRCDFMGASLKCEEKIIYSYVTEDFFVNHLIKTRESR
jgi:hypothetical protein